MREKLKEKYLPLTYKERLMEELALVRQDNMTIIKYMNRFDELMVWSDIIEDDRHTLARFHTRLREDIRKEMMLHLVYTLEDAYQRAYEIEWYLHTPLHGKPNFQAREFSTHKSHEISH